jgi:hypothetical protein
VCPIIAERLQATPRIISEEDSEILIDLANRIIAAATI